MQLAAARTVAGGLETGPDTDLDLEIRISFRTAEFSQNKALGTYVCTRTNPRDPEVWRMGQREQDR